MNEVILEVLKDEYPQTVGQIWKEISDQKLHVPPNQGKTPEQSCNARCQLMTRSVI